MRDELKILCPFCNQQYTATMINELFGIGGGCESCGNGAEVTGNIDIRCDNCEKIVYRKEI